MKPATLWFRFTRNKKGEENWEFNHLEDGHCPNDVPTPKCDNHKLVWKGGKWMKDLVYLDQTNKVIHSQHSLKETQ